MRLSRKALALLVLVVLLAALLITGILVWDWGRFVVDTAEAVHAEYGIDVPLSIALFGIGEVVFIASVVVMLKEAGEQVTWGSIHSFKLKNLNLGSRKMTAWLWVNRASWVVPWLVVIALSVGKVPWWATTAALLEVGSTLALGVVLTLGMKLPWWNSAHETEKA